MDSTTDHVKELETINKKILELAKFVVCQHCFHIVSCLNRNRALPQLVQSSDDNNGKEKHTN